LSDADVGQVKSLSEVNEPWKCCACGIFGVKPCPDRHVDLVAIEPERRRRARPAVVAHRVAQLHADRFLAEADAGKPNIAIPATAAAATSECDVPWILLGCTLSALVAGPGRTSTERLDVTYAV
jgi:hypothetical protein